MYGDYEAQRHWMEITLHVPMNRWYYYDLEWWGLDYPPLTAYVSWICGKMYEFFCSIRIYHSLVYFKFYIIPYHFDVVEDLCLIQNGLH